MKSNKIIAMLMPNNKVYLWIILVLAIALLYYNKIIAFSALFVLIVLIVYNIFNSREKMKKWTKYIENLSQDLGTAAQSSLINLPMPLSLVNLEGKLIWYNSKFSDLFGERDLLDVEIDKVIPQLDIETLLSGGHESSEFKIGERHFQLKKNVVNIDSRNKDERIILMLYWIDVTSYVKLKNKYNSERPVVAMVQVDNYDEVINNTKEEKVPFVLSEIESRINTWVSRMNGMVKKYQKDKYMICFESKFLSNLEAKRFSILDDIREIDMGNRIPATLSMGVGGNGKDFDQLEEYAFSGLELALARGGDQAVVRKNSHFEFYGGKTKAVEKRNRVKARIIAHAMRPLIDESNEVFIMGHKYPDMDAFGAAIGIYRAVINRGKEAYIVLNEVNDSIKNVYELFGDDPTYKFISSQEAISKIDVGDLLVVVDTHRPSFTECPELIERMDRIVLFDHHRRGAEFIEETLLNYLEPYASSTCELVTEMLQYIEDKSSIREVEAEALLAGIILDTKSFSFKTGVRTFEAASFLRRYGADTTKVMKLFQDDFETIQIKSEIITNADIHFDSIAISICEKPMSSIKLIASQSADELLRIKGVDTSFVIGQQNNGEVIISGRSLGNRNVQLILEKLGGGGHLTTAGAQFENTTIEEVMKRLLVEIENYISEE
jgi:c-di-AMP phosphodiesterase-like protein